MNSKKIYNSDKNILKYFKITFDQQRKNYSQNCDQVKKYTKILNRLYETPETFENKRKYMKEYLQKKIR